MYSPQNTTTVQPEHKDYHQLFKEVVTQSKQNATFFSSLYKQLINILTNVFVKPILTVLSVISRIRTFGFCLFDDRIFNLMKLKDDCCVFEPCDNSPADPHERNLIKSYCENKKFLFLSCVISKIGKASFISHASLFIQGKTAKGKQFSIFFDPMGYDPLKERLRLYKGKYVKCSVGKILDDYLEVLPSFKGTDVLFTKTCLQKDWFSCRDYCILFAEKLMSAFEQDDFSPEDFMQRTANGEMLSYSEVRERAAKMSHVNLRFFSAAMSENQVQM